MPRRRSLDRLQRVPPGTPLALDRRSPLAEGLQFYTAAAGGGTLLDLAKPRVGSAPAWSTSPAGPCTTASTFTNARTTDAAFTSGNWTVACYFFHAALLTTEYIDVVSRGSYTSESVNAGWVLEMTPPTDAAGYKFRFGTRANNGVGSYKCDSATTPSVGLWSYVGTSTPTAGTATRTLYLNGKSDAATTIGNMNPAATAGDLLVGSGAKARVLMAAAWSRALSAAEVSDLHQRPFLLAAPARPTSYFLPTTSTAGSRGGGSLTLMGVGR